MNRVILVTDRKGNQEVYSSVSVLCKAKDWVYNTVRNKIPPFDHDGHYIERFEIIKKVADN